MEVRQLGLGLGVSVRDMLAMLMRLVVESLIDMAGARDRAQDRVAGAGVRKVVSLLVRV